MKRFFNFYTIRIISKLLENMDLETKVQGVCNWKIIGENDRVGIVGVSNYTGNGRSGFAAILVPRVTYLCNWFRN